MENAAPFRLGPATLDPARGEISGPEGHVRLEPRVMEFAAYLAHRPDEVVSREQLIESVWAGYPGADQSLNRAASMVRKALSEVGGDPEQLQTVPKRGYRLTGPVEFTSGAQRSRSFRRFAFLGAIGVLVLASAIGLGSHYWPAGSPERSIAVLPFKTIGADEPSPLAEGLHDDLLTRLSNIAELTVISRTSVEQYRDTSKNVRQIGRELGVKWILEGAVQESGDAVQVNAQLVDARSDSHAWADQFRRTLTADNLFDMQSEITKRITHSLEAQISPAEEERVAHRPTENLEAYRLYLQGRRLFEQRQPAAFKRRRQAADYFMQALEIDPDYARAWAGLADATITLVAYAQNNDDIEVPSSVPSPEESARRALELDPELAEAHAALGHIQYGRNNNSAAWRSLNRAVQLRPSYAYAQYGLGLLFVNNLGRPESAVKHLERAVELNPASWFYREYLATAYLANGQVDKAHQEARRLRREYAQANPPWTLVRVLCHLGRFEEARQVVEEYLPQIEHPAEWVRTSWRRLHAMTMARAGDEDRARELLADLEAREVSPGTLGMVYAALGETEAAFEAFERADDSELPNKALRYFFPHILASVRKDPRYDELLRRINRAEGLNPDGSLPDEES